MHVVWTDPSGPHVAQHPEGPDWSSRYLVSRRCGTGSSGSGLSAPTWVPDRYVGGALEGAMGPALVYAVGEEEEEAAPLDGAM